MNTIRVTRPPVEMPRRRIDLHLRTLLLAVLLCVAVFACCFAIGRAERPKLAAGEGLPPSVPAASAGVSIPLALSGAPPIDMRDIVLIRTPAKTESSRLSATTAVAVSAVSAGVPSSVVPTTSSTVTPAITTQSAATPSPADAPVSGGQHSSGGTSTPVTSAPAVKHAPAASSETSSSSSFDSSG
jgi:hypothetical protein